MTQNSLTANNDHQTWPGNYDMPTGDGDGQASGEFGFSALANDFWSNTGLTNIFGASNADNINTDGTCDPFAAFEIPFWMGQDQYGNLMDE